MSDVEWEVPEGHVLVKCPTCRYTNDVPAEMASNAKYVGDNCERCALPAVERITGSFQPLDDAECEQIAHRSVIAVARGVGPRLGDGNIGLADILSMVAREAIQTTFCAMAADEEYIRAAEAVARRHQERDSVGGAGVVAQSDRSESNLDGEGALGTVPE